MRQKIRRSSTPGRCRAGTMVLVLGLVVFEALTAGAQTAPDLVAPCAPCHGFEGVSKDVEVPNLAGQHDVYLSDQLRAFRAGRRRHTDMAFMSRELTDDEIDELAGYYARLPAR